MMSELGQLYRRVYDALCGRHPNLNVLHFQWLPLWSFRSRLAKELGALEGTVLDLGCGGSPYRPLMRRAENYVGADVAPGPTIDLIVDLNQGFTLQAAAYDAVVCTQVLQYVAEPEEVISAIHAALRPGGSFVWSVPFFFNQHSVLPDRWRLTSLGAADWCKAFDQVDVYQEGGIGSTIGALLLNWFETSSNSTRGLRFLKPLFLPVWMAFSLLVNLVSMLLDRVDQTERFYGNVLVVAKKAGEGQGPPQASSHA